MKAAILAELNSPLLVEDVRTPNLDCGQVLVKVHASGICGAQIGEIAGIKGEDKFLPHLLGHEGGGVVVKIGLGVTQVREGDHVVLHWRPGVGIEAPFPRYIWNGGPAGGGKVTTFNEYAVVSENRLTPVGDNIPFEIAALMGCSVTTALGVINNDAKLKIGQSIAVSGCGGVGLNVIQGAAMVSANPIIAIDILPHKLEMAKEFHATHTIDLNEEFLQDGMERIMGSEGVDVFVECSGVMSSISAGYSATAPAGKTILVGLPDSTQQLVIPSLLKHYHGKVLVASLGGQTNPSVDISRYLALYMEGVLKLDELITHRFPLEEVNEAIDVVRTGRAGRCMLQMT